MDEILKENYNNPELPGSFSGLESFDRALRSRGMEHFEKSRKQRQDVYTKHHPARRVFPTNKVIVYGIDATWQIDLADMTKYSRQNNGFKWILICIDILSKYVWVHPLKTKEGLGAAKAFEIILSLRRN